MADRRPSVPGGDKNNIFGKVISAMFKSPLRRDTASSVMDLNDRCRRSTRERVGHSGRPSQPAPRISQPNYRVNIPSTRLSSRAGCEETTDSLKLYEEQIRNYTPSDGKRPLSLCFDFVALDDPRPPSSSSSSTMSSSSSSNSQTSSGCNVSGSREELVFKKDHRASPLFKNGSPVHGQFASIWNGTPPYISQNETREDRPLSPSRRLSAPSPNFSRSNSTTSSRSSAITVIAAPGTTTSSTGDFPNCRVAISGYYPHPVQELDPSFLDEDYEDPDNLLPSPVTPPSLPSSAAAASSSDSNSSSEDNDDSSEDDVLMAGGAGHVTILRGQPLPIVLPVTGSGAGLLGQERYDLSTLDMAYRDMLKVEVHQIRCSDPASPGGGTSGGKYQQESLDSLPDEELSARVYAFNGNRWGLSMGILDSNPRVAGSIRIFMNLIKPIKMSMQQTQRSSSTSSLASTSSSDSSSSPSSSPTPAAAAAVSPPTPPGSPAVVDNPAGVVSFFLPRGTPKLLHITSSTTTNEVIDILLKKFHIQESPRKFALFEHTLENESTVFARQFDSIERPLVTLLSWAAEGRKALEAALTKKRIVLQENEDSGEVKWQEFSLPELQNFIRILNKEELEYKDAIYEQYGLMRHHMLKHLEALRTEDLSGGAIQGGSDGQLQAGAVS